MLALGMRSLFKCAACGHTAIVSGDTDGGFAVLTKTFLCKGCHDLVDVVTDRATERGWENAPLRCPRCSSTDLTEWIGPKGPCPKCPGQMEWQDALYIWD